MCSIERVVDVERDRVRRRVMAGAVDIHHLAPDTDQPLQIGCVLPSRHRRLAGQTNRLSGALPSAIMKAGSCLRASRSSASSYRQAIASNRAAGCPKGCATHAKGLSHPGSRRRADPQCQAAAPPERAAERRHPSVIAPPSNAAVTFFERMAGNENEIWAGSVMAAVAISVRWIGSCEQLFSTPDQRLTLPLPPQNLALMNNPGYE